ncbi:MAG: glycosyltransferase [Marmoricola sp.]
MSSRVEVAQVVTRCIAGAGGVAVRGALQLDPDRYRVTLVTGQGGPLTERARDAGMDVVIEPSLVAPLSPFEDAKALAHLTRLFRERSFDVVHTHSAKAGAVGRVAAHRTGTPAIVHTYHGFPFHDFQSRLRRSAYIAVERRLAAITDVVLAVGSGVATEALRRGLAEPSSLRVVAPVVESTAVLQTPAARALARTALKLDSDVPVIGTTGRVDFQKAPEHLLEAARLLRHRDAVVVWFGSGPQLAEMRRRVRAENLESRFRFIGERDDIAALLPALDVFCMSSRYEGLPCAVVEAMRCGLPVVATAVNSVPDLVVPGDSGVLVPPARPAALASALDRLLDNPIAAHRLALSGLRRAGERYDAARLGETLDEVYSETLTASAGALAG